MKMEVEIRVMTLNCWAIVHFSKHRKERISAITNHIAEADYDFVFLQEVWSQEDYEHLCKKTVSVFPYSHYFHSGVIGSGVCIFSKSQIVDTMMQKFSLNGYAHKFYHGDWFGGKVVGLCKVVHRGLHLNLYVTHMHAEYGHHYDPYLAHRVLQAFEFSQFVQMTGSGADASIIAGDFNTEEMNLPFRIILHNTGSVDTFHAHPHTASQGYGTTCGHPRNSYTLPKELRIAPKGQRIDYVLYNCNKGTAVECLACETPLDKIPNNTISYSDHEAVVAVLRVSKTIAAPGCQPNLPERTKALEEGRDLLASGLASLRGDRIFFYMMAVLMMSLLLVSAAFELPLPFRPLAFVARVVLSLILGFTLWMASAVNRIEHSSLVAGCKGMTVLLEALRQSEFQHQPCGLHPPDIIN